MYIHIFSLVIHPELVENHVEIVQNSVEKATYCVGIRCRLHKKLYSPRHEYSSLPVFYLPNIGAGEYKHLKFAGEPAHYGRRIAVSQLLHGEV